MLRLEAPPAKGAPVSDDILAVQKMAKECEQKVRKRGAVHFFFILVAMYSPHQPQINNQQPSVHIYCVVDVLG